MKSLPFKPAPGAGTVPGSAGIAEGFGDRLHALGTPLTVLKKMSAKLSGQERRARKKKALF